jgi:hypothetical protein
MRSFIQSLEEYWTDSIHFLLQRGCAVICVKFYIWFWGALVVGFLFGWMARTRLWHWDEEERQHDPAAPPEDKDQPR